ncbi:plant UBX domain-containing protein 7-like [Physcomitrium patens]|uniref:plant UBX domain-containing protein 7-like n=1 Tax=Physcomitrium patens TaxID=3218 RepID=UPI003CCE1BE1
MSDSIKLLWSFCSTKIKEPEEGHQFHLNQMIPGANRSLVYSSDASIEDPEVANAMLSMYVLDWKVSSCWTLPAHGPQI